MLVKYTGGQTAINMSAGATGIRLIKDKFVLLSADQVESLEANDYMKTLIKDGYLHIDDLSGHDKAELEQIAVENDITFPEKAGVRQMRDILSGKTEVEPEAEAEADAKAGANKTSATDSK